MIVILKSYFMEVSQSRTTQPSTVRRTIRGDGKHTVSARTYGLVEFDKCGNYVFGGEVRTGRVYKIYYSDFPAHMTIVSDNLNRFAAKCVN